MNPEDLQGMPTMTLEQEAQQAQQDQQLAASGQDPENGQPQDPNADPSMQAGQPNADMQDPSIGMPQQQPGGAPDPMDALAHVVLSYMDYTTGIKNNKQLDEQTRSGIMLQMAQAINYFVPLLKDNGQQGDLAMKQAELAIKKQEHEMNMEMKQLELGYKMQEHDMKMTHSQQENAIKLNHAQQESKMKLQQGKDNHQANIVQSKEAHASKMAQQKQAAQVKASSNPSNKGAK